jgi:hypothetical protein
MYDAGLTGTYRGETPNIYGNYFSDPVTPNSSIKGDEKNPYFKGNDSKVFNMIVRYYNNKDFALKYWDANNSSKPDDLTSGYHYQEGDGKPDTYNPGGGDLFYFKTSLASWRRLYFLADRFEIFARCLQARTRALGTINEHVDQFTMEHNLKDWGYDDMHYSHSREFRSDIVREWPFWKAVGVDFKLTGLITDY